MLAYVENDDCGLHRLHQEQSVGWKFVVRLQCMNFMQECLSDCNRWLLLNNYRQTRVIMFVRMTQLKLLILLLHLFLLMLWFLQLLELASYLLDTSCCHVEGKIILLKS